MATACTSGTDTIERTSQGRHASPIAEKTPPATTQKNVRVGEHGPRRLPIALGVPACDERLRADAHGAQAAAEEPNEDERGQERRLPVRRLGARQVREVDDVDLVDDALRQHRDDRGQRQPEDGPVTVPSGCQRLRELERLHAGGARGRYRGPRERQSARRTERRVTGGLSREL